MKIILFFTFKTSKLFHGLKQYVSWGTRWCIALKYLLVDLQEQQTGDQREKTFLESSLNLIPL